MNRLFLALLIALGVLGSVRAQTDDAVFAEGAFDQAVAGGQASEEANKLIWLGGVSLVGGTNLVIPEAATGYGSTSQFAGKGFLKATKPTLGSLFLSYNYTHTLWAASNEPVLTTAYARQGLDPSTPTFRLSEFHLSFDVAKVVFLRWGNQLIDWGVSSVWSPADFINRKVADPNSSLDTRAGKPGVRVHIPWSSGNVFVFADASRSLTAGGTPRDLVETGTVGAKVDTTWLGWNWGLIGNFGKTSDPRVGFTLVGALLGVDLWSEVGTVLPGPDRSFSWSTSVGGERSFGQDSEWTLRAEGFWNPSGTDDTTLTSSQAFTPYYWGKLYGYTELLKKKLWGPDVNGSLSATSNLSDRSYQTTASLRTAFSGLVPFSVYVQYNGGPKAREFTGATGGPAYTLGLRSTVEF